MSEDAPYLPPNPNVFYWCKAVYFTVLAASILFVLAMLTAPMVIRTRKDPGQIEPVSNARQIGLALYEFEAKYGSFPDKGTVASINAEFPGHGFDLSGNSSNAFYRQLMASGITQSEQMFYARTKDVRKPDGDVRPGKALERGEVGFAYVSGLTSKDNPATPLVLAPVVPGTTRFDPKPFKGRAVVLRIDNSATTYEIKNDGRIYDKGIDLLSPKHPVWGGKAPHIHFPEL